MQNLIDRLRKFVCTIIVHKQYAYISITKISTYNRMFMRSGGEGSKGATIVCCIIKVMSSDQGHVIWGSVSSRVLILGISCAYKRLKYLDFIEAYPMSYCHTAALIVCHLLCSYSKFNLKHKHTSVFEDLFTPKLTTFKG